jgi:hypothetical protein
MNYMELMMSPELFVVQDRGMATPNLTWFGVQSEI